ncbi:hypothetical protein SBF1_3270004 [Candidatus Desulfosporosinus infrequens]|uniref:Uncharacterized protein n=1 Tax=Candidatus Desulfosporosinus infrequens TaxID=2043169 RepID=A0A2U3L0I3_9FIRM|nr:hypothetical protein SBF1_3270004 [Candidatus Desulfosporosinus infrequens]
MSSEVELFQLIPRINSNLLYKYLELISKVQGSIIDNIYGPSFYLIYDFIC